jgi:uncharacterized protein YbaA (DUF1428 family)
MTYVEGFVTAVPTAARDAYVAHAAAAQTLFDGYGMRRMTENWGDDVPDGTTTDFARAVQKTADETVVISWFEYPDRATRDAANARMMADERMEALGETMPFDGKRMIYGGFAAIIEDGVAGGAYIDAFVAAVPTANRDAYRDHATQAAALFREHGALRIVEAWEDDVPDGKVTDFRRAVQAQGDEAVVFAWIEWPDRATRDAAWARVEKDARMTAPDAMPFDGKRMIYGGFVPLPLDRKG